MNKAITVKDGSLLYGLLAEMAGDIILNTDQAGFIEHASPGLDVLGIYMSDMLIAPHISDLAVAADRPAIHAYIAEASSGISVTENVQFAAPPCASEAGQDASQKYYSLTLRPALGNAGEVAGLVGVMRQVEPAHLREEQLIAASMTDSLTGLPNRRAFLASANDLLGRGPGGALALLEIDDFRAVALRFGQTAADEVVTAFAQFLSVMHKQGHTLARIEGGRFALLMPDAHKHTAFGIVEEIVSTFARVTTGTKQEAGVVTASAGVVTLAGSLDAILSRAERALVLARAGGGTRTELGDQPPRYLAGRVRI